MSVALLDVNVLIALADSRHRDHVAALGWFERRHRAGWATCPIVENGFVRIFGHAAYPGGPGSVGAALDILRRIRGARGHVFWHDTLSMAEIALGPQAAALGPQQLTDVYLLALAVRHHGAFVTFDRRLDPACVRGGATALEVIPSA